MKDTAIVRRDGLKKLFIGRQECSNQLSRLPFNFSYNLYELIKKNNYQGFSLSLIRRFCNSIIKCLKLLYQENIIHCDLKPVSDFIPFALLPLCSPPRFRFFIMQKVNVRRVSAAEFSERMRMCRRHTEFIRVWKI